MATRFKLFLVEHDLTQEQVAQLTGLPRNTVSRIANGQKPNLTNAQKLLKALNNKLGTSLTVDYFWPLEEDDGE